MTKIISAISKDLYRKEIVPKLKEEFGYKSIMQVPRLKKIVISQGIGEATGDKKRIDDALLDLASIAGQKAIPCFSKKDVAGFKLRKGIPIGIKTTLRRDKMYEFLDKLVKIVLPRVRDFRGVSRKFDGRGNYNMGISEQLIFLELFIERVKKIMGMNIAFITTAKTDKEAETLLSLLKIPFRKK